MRVTAPWMHIRRETLTAQQWGGSESILAANGFVPPRAGGGAISGRKGPRQGHPARPGVVRLAIRQAADRLHRDDQARSLVGRRGAADLCVECLLRGLP